MISIAEHQTQPGVLVADDWRALRRHPSGVLFIGPAADTSVAIAHLLPMWPVPIEICQASKFIPDGAVVTLVLQDAGDLRPAAQEALFEWLNDASAVRRVISAVREPLYPRVQSGLFSRRLYYRLNTVTIDLTAARR